MFRRRTFRKRNFRRFNRRVTRRPTRFKRRFNRRRIRKRQPINTRAVITKTITQDYDLVLNALTATTFIEHYQAFIAFAPTSSEIIVAHPAITMLNVLPHGMFTMGTIPDGEEASWEALYAKTYLSKVLVSYQPNASAYNFVPSIPTTSGATSSLAGVMHTVPIYDNLDDVITNGGQLIQDPANAASLSHMMQKPYSRTHSLMKKWTRVLKPSTSLQIPTYYTGGANDHVYKKAKPWMDMTTSGGNTCTGLYIMCKPLTAYDNSAVAIDIPDGTAIKALVLGRLTFKMYQKFRLRN